MLPFRWLLESLCLYLTVFITLNDLTAVAANRVLELNDKFVQLVNQERQSFLIKFYAPWCHHCQELEPVWNQVAQQLHSLDTKIIVGKLDCTKFTSVASQYGVKGFPTILYINSQKKLEYRGDRNKEDIIDFALRVHGPPVRYLSSCEQIDELVRNDRRVVFINFGPVDSTYTQLGTSLQQYDWFYRSMILCEGFGQGIYVLKSKGIVHKYDQEKDGDLQTWIKKQRFPHFARISGSNLHLAMSSHKYVAISLVEEHKSNAKLVDQKNVAFYRTMESIAYNYMDPEKNYLFGWSSDFGVFNSIVMHKIAPIPNLLVLNSSTVQYFLYNSHGSPRNINDQKELIGFLDDILHNPHRVEAFGGDTTMHRIYRVLFDTVSSTIAMYNTNPILTLLMFGLPASFFAMIIYLTCCSDILDAKDEDGEGEEEDEEEEETFPKMSTIPGNPKDYNPKLPGVRRIMREAFELRESTYQYYAQPLEDNIYEWHFTIRGPDDTDFQGGVYHGRIMLPNEYPMKPPNFIFLTPNGRFDTNKKICLNISGFHPESWQPCWSIRTVLLAIISFLPVPYDGSVGSVNYPVAERKKLANLSKDYSCDICACGGKKIADFLKPEPVKDEAHNSQWYKDFQVYIQNLSAEHSNNPSLRIQDSPANTPANNEPSNPSIPTENPSQESLPKAPESQPKVIPSQSSVPTISAPARAVPEAVSRTTYRPYDSLIDTLKGPIGGLILWFCFGLALTIIVRRLYLTFYGIE